MSLDERISDLIDRAKSGRYRSPPVRRVLIPKGDGKERRPIGVPSFEDKLLQRAIEMLLTPVFEQDFYDFSYAPLKVQGARAVLLTRRSKRFGMG